MKLSSSSTQQSFRLQSTDIFGSRIRNDAYIHLFVLYGYLNMFRYYVYFLKFLDLFVGHTFCYVVISLGLCLNCFRAVRAMNETLKQNCLLQERGEDRSFAHSSTDMNESPDLQKNVCFLYFYFFNFNIFLGCSTLQEVFLFSPSCKQTCLSLVASIQIYLFGITANHCRRYW